MVGYLGDGINDAPSLHAADVGISVEAAVDVAKDAADIILLEHDLACCRRGVLEGRRTFGNIMKYILMGTSSNFGNMFSMAGAALFLPFLPMLPVQILLNNFLYDLSEVPIPMDTVDPSYVARRRHWDMDFIRNFMLVHRSGQLALRLPDLRRAAAVFHAGRGAVPDRLVRRVAGDPGAGDLRHPHAPQSAAEPAQPLSRHGLARRRGLAVLLPFTPLGRRFGFVAPPLSLLAALAGMLVCYLVLAEAVKRWFYRRLPPQGSSRAAVLRPNIPFARPPS